MAKPDIDDAGTDQGSTEAALPQSQAASEQLENPSTEVQLPDVRSTVEDLSLESRGQLTQRHKKVHCRAVLQALPFH